MKFKFTKEHSKLGGINNAIKIKAKNNALIEAGNWQGRDIRTLREYLINSRGRKCEYCELSEWNEEAITVETHHIDGDSKNNKLDNVELLCPNCHSQTDTFKCKNKGKGTRKR